MHFKKLLNTRLSLFQASLLYAVLAVIAEISLILNIETLAFCLILLIVLVLISWVVSHRTQPYTMNESIRIFGVTFGVLVIIFGIHYMRGNFFESLETSASNVFACTLLIAILGFGNLLSRAFYRMLDILFLTPYYTTKHTAISWASEKLRVHTKKMFYSISGAFLCALILSQIGINLLGAMFTPLDSTPLTIVLGIIFTALYWIAFSMWVAFNETNTHLFHYTRMGARAVGVWILSLILIRCIFILAQVTEPICNDAFTHCTQETMRWDFSLFFFPIEYAVLIGMILFRKKHISGIEKEKLFQ